MHSNDYKGGQYGEAMKLWWQVMRPAGSEIHQWPQQKKNTKIAKRKEQPLPSSFDYPTLHIPKIPFATKKFLPFSRTFQPLLHSGSLPATTEMRVESNL